MPGEKIRVGDRFGKLVVDADLGTAEHGVNFVRRLRCICDCGNVKLAWASHLRAGCTKSCGCLYASRTSNVPAIEASIRIVVRNYKANAKSRGIPFDLFDAKIRELLVLDCTYCGIAPSSEVTNRRGTGKFLYNGIYRVDNDLGYVEGNVVPCCTPCNIAKAQMSVSEFLAWVERVHDHSTMDRGDDRNVCRLVVG